MGDGKVAVLRGENLIFFLRDAVNLVRAVRFVLHEFGREGFGKKDLADVRGASEWC